jgi:probable rRNA maturation factor
MILLDPDLDPYSDPASTRDALLTPGASAADSLKNKRRDRVPSARTLRVFLSAAQAAVRLRGRVTVLLTTDATLRRLNRQFRGKNTATDVLSFPAGGPIAGEIAGDLAVSVPTALRHAREHGHALSIEIKVLILHGLLHLAGYDHEIDDGQMARRERLLRARLRLPQGLIERAGLQSRPKRTLPGRTSSKSLVPAKQAAEKLKAEGGGGFNPRIKPAESTRALAPEERFPPDLPNPPSSSGACKAAISKLPRRASAL